MRGSGCPYYGSVLTGVNESAASPHAHDAAAGPLREAGITHVVYGWPHRAWGGSQRYLLTLMRHLPDDVRRTVVLPHGSDPALLAEIAAAGAICATLPVALADRRPESFARRVRDHWDAWQVAWHLWRTCRALAERGTVLHLDVMPTLMTLPLAQLARRVAVVGTLHTRIPRLSAARTRAWRLRLARLAAAPGYRLITANRDVHSSLEPFVSPAMLARVPLAYSPVDTDEIARVRAVLGARGGADRRALRQRAGASDTDLLVVTGAQRIPRKGREVLQRAAASVRAVCPATRFVWVTPEPGAAAEKTGDVMVVSQAALGGTRHDYLQLVGAADLFVLPSFEDGLPLAIVEAMALGIPVVSTRINGIPEAVLDGTTGLLVEPGDAGALASAIIALHGDRARRERMGEAGRAHAELFRADAMVRTTFGVYAEATAAVRRA